MVQLSAPMMKFSISTFLHFCTQQVFPLDILPNLNLLRTLELVIFGTLFLRIYDRHLFSVFEFLDENLRKYHFLKNAARIEIKITITVKIARIHISQSFSYSLCELLYKLSLSYDFNPCGIFEKMTSVSISPILPNTFEKGKLMAPVNSRI